MVIEVSEQTVRSDKVSVFAVFFQDLSLHGGKSDTSVGDKAVIIQQIARIMAVVENRARGINLIPCCIGSAPDNSAPGLVQIVESFVLLFQECTKSNAVRFGMKLIGLTVQFVVDLPADDGGMGTIMFSHLFDDPFAILLINRRVIVVVPASTVTVKSPVGHGIEHFRISLRQPGGWGGRRRTENNFDFFLFAEV